MAGIPKVKITFDADFDELKKGIKGGQDEIEGFGSKVGEFGKKAAAAFAVAAVAAAGYAVKLAVDGVKAAIEDEAAQVRLATALKNATGATNEMIKSVEDQILKQSLATGVSDDKLRPALSRLALSTNDVTKAQDLLTLALDVSQSTGKSLDTVANALGKAYDGNTASLGKLGIGLSAAELKAMSFTEVQDKLSELFGGSAAANAETYAGQIARLKVTFDEAKETIGAKLLPIIEKLVGFIVEKVVPALGNFADLFKPITDAISENKKEFTTFIGFIQKYVVPVLVTVLGGAFKVVGEIAGGVITVVGAVIGGLNALISGAVVGINALITVYNSIPFLPNISKITAPSISVPKISIPKVGSTATVPTITVPTISGGGSSGGSSSGGGISSAVAGAAIAGAFTDSQNEARVLAGAMAKGGAFTDSQNEARLRAEAMARGGASTDSQNAATFNITVNGAIDSEGTARTIVNTLNDSFYRGGGGGANSLVTA